MSPNSIIESYLVDGIARGVQSHRHIYAMLSERLHALIVRLIVVDLINADGIDKECLHEWCVECALIGHCKRIVSGSWGTGSTVAVAIYDP